MRGLSCHILKIWAVCLFLASSTLTCSETFVLPVSKISSISDEVRPASINFFINSKSEHYSNEQTKSSFRILSAPSTSSTSSGSGWVGIQAITVFFVIIAAVGFALFLRPSSINRAQYQPVQPPRIHRLKCIHYLVPKIKQQRDSSAQPYSLLFLATFILTIYYLVPSSQQTSRSFAEYSGEYMFSIVDISSHTYHPYSISLKLIHSSKMQLNSTPLPPLFTLCIFCSYSSRSSYL